VNKYRVLSKQHTIEKLTRTLVHELGPVETSRFLAIPQQRREESVQRHRQWQDGLNQEGFLNDVFGG